MIHKHGQSIKLSPKGSFFLEAIVSLISQYGTLVYLLLFGYCALKSGSLPLFGGYAAQAGALDVALVAVATFAGGYWVMNCALPWRGGLAQAFWRHGRVFWR